MNILGFRLRMSQSVSRCAHIRVRKKQFNDSNCNDGNDDDDDDDVDDDDDYVLIQHTTLNQFMWKSKQHVCNNPNFNSITKLLIKIENIYFNATDSENTKTLILLIQDLLLNSNSNPDANSNAYWKDKC